MILNNVFFNINGNEIYIISSFGVCEVMLNIDILSVICFVDKVLYYVKDYGWNYVCVVFIFFCC